MIYVLGALHFYQLNKWPSSKNWAKVLFDLYPRYKKDFEDLRKREQTDRETLEDAINVWINRHLDREWKEAYEKRLKNLIKDKNISIIFEEADGNKNPNKTNTESLAEELGLKYLNIEPLYDSRPYPEEESSKDFKKHEEVMRWREGRWIENIINNYEKNSSHLLIIGENHRVNKFNWEGKSVSILGDSIAEKIKKEGIKVNEISLDSFWSDDQSYLSIIQSIKEEAGI